ncbi:MAG: carboxypeptidase-like regulatory domain-containing protein [Acidobacteria bacterium]|nr:carboxypeptidase-like regulatory domain-containing protein [Acidobacteriota bacterium]
MNQATCNSVPDLSRKGLAIFVGTVVEVYPESFEDMLDRWGKILGRTVSEDDPPTLTEVKRVVLEMWRGTLTPVEAERILTASSQDEVESIGDHALGWAFPKRVKLRVSESFTAAAADSIELFTGMGGGDCGIPFEQGGSYLVFAFREEEKAGRWMSTTCSGTSQLLDAEEDVRTLRARKARMTIPPRIHGTVSGGGQPLANVRVKISGEPAEQTAFTDERGRFVFNDLLPTRYRVTMELSGWHATAFSRYQEVVDLTSDRCAQLYLSLERDKR